MIGNFSDFLEIQFQGGATGRTNKLNSIVVSGWGGDGLPLLDAG